jgi:hypothetical protein
MDCYDRMEQLGGKQDQLLGIAAAQDARADKLVLAGDAEGAAWQRLMAATNRRYAGAVAATLEKHMHDSVEAGKM